MKHKIIVGWFIVLISTLFMTMIFWVAFDINLVMGIMIPIDIGVSATIIPIIIIDQKPELKGKIFRKNNQYKKLQSISYKHEKDINNKIREISTHSRQDVDIQIIGEEEITKDSIKVLVGDIKVLDIPSNKSTKSSLELLREHFDNKELLEIFEKKDSLIEIIKALDEFELTIFSEEFFNKIDEFDWSDKQKLEFIKDMIVFSPRERMEILSSMTGNSAVDN